ncbi:hypothetical protein WAK64_12055 [Bacillus spongiae]|uniref:Uncharacterized protein n=1 Tax=Bacillus spongiae TaxID=2683610 RepID=A0ABU8HEZ4_9BACI
MLSDFAFNLFLYFPEDKSEYIPAGITMAIFTVIAILTFRLFIKVSKRQELQTKELEKSIMEERQSKEK